MEYLPLARAFSIGRPYALGTIFLASLYQALGKYLTKVPYHRVGGALIGLYKSGSLPIPLSYQVLILSTRCLWGLI